MSRKNESLVNRHLQTLLSQPFMKDKEDGPAVVEPFSYQRELGWELLTSDATAQLTRRLQEDLPALHGEVAELVGVLALANVASQMTPATALKLATSRKMLKLMAAKVESHNDHEDGEVVAFPGKR